MPTQDELKKMVGYKAVDDYVKSGMVVGLGTGSTAYFAVERVGELLKSGALKDIVCIPTSVRTKEQAESLGIPLTTLATHSALDVAIDGADAVDPALNLIKGGGGALLRWWRCAPRPSSSSSTSRSCATPSARASRCPSRSRRSATSTRCARWRRCRAKLRMGSAANNKADGDEIAVTDNGNYIVDLFFTAPIKDAAKAGDELKATVGVVDHGLFCGMASCCIVAGKDGVSLKTAQ